MHNICKYKPYLCNIVIHQQLFVFEQDVLRYFVAHLYHTGKILLIPTVFKPCTEGFPYLFQLFGR
jgi:hypothetical protein